jgi:hypothetical protein
VSLAACALTAYGGAYAYIVTRDPTAATATGGIGGLGLLVLAYALVRTQEAALGPALALQGVAYTIALLVRGGAIEPGAPLVSAALLLACELAAWSISEHDAIVVERSVRASRVTGLTGLTLGGLAVATLVVALAAAPAGGGLGWTTLGAVAAVVAIALATVFARR